MGFREGLVEVRGHSTAPDFLPFLREGAADPVLEQQVLEQIVLTPNVSAYFEGSLAEDFIRGPLLEEGVVTRIPFTKPQFFFEAFPTEAIEGLLRARGILIPQAEFLPRLVAAIEATEAEESTKASGGDVPSFFDEALTRNASTAHGLGFRNRFSEEQWAAYDRRKAAKKAAYPIYEAFETIAKLSWEATERSAFLVTPCSWGVAGATLNQPLDTTQASHLERKSLFRIAAQDMGKVVVRGSLRDTLKLAKDPASEALRQKVTEWVDALGNGEIATLPGIRKEIQQATASLERTGHAKKLGTFLTYAAVPVGIGEMLIGSPGLVGFCLGGVAVAADLSVQLTQKKFRWALFGRE